ncbi:hypothetical protein BGZ68_003037, partial [Mortierella alpina]
GSLEQVLIWVEAGAADEVPDVPLSAFNAMVTLVERLGANRLLQHIVRQAEGRFASVINVAPLLDAADYNQGAAKIFLRPLILPLVKNQWKDVLEDIYAQRVQDSSRVFKEVVGACINK